VPALSDAVVRLGVVGGGLIAQLAHLPALRELDRLFDVRALAEPSSRVRAALARRYGIAAAVADHGALLDGGELDAVLVCSPNGTHARVVADALDAGLHVLVEKPLCLTPADGDAIVARAQRAERVVQVGYMKRFDPGYERLLEALPETGRLRLAVSATVDPGIGERLRPAGFVAADDGDPAFAAELRRDSAAQVASALGTDDPRHVAPFSDAVLGALVHDANLVLGAHPGSWRVTDAAADEDGALAYGAWAHADGTRWSAAWLRVPAAGSFREELAFYATDGVLRLRFPAPYLGAAPAQLSRDGDPERRWSTPGNGYVRQLEHFHACVTRGAECRTPAEQGARDVQLLTELYRTAVAA
jgi:predicted dehydrogenase